MADDDVTVEAILIRPVCQKVDEVYLVMMIEFTRSLHFSRHNFILETLKV